MKKIKHLDLLKGDSTSNFYGELKSWIDEVALLYMTYLDDLGYLPFHDHEQCAVSLLVAAASRAGHLALAECAVDREESAGRADLWIVSENTHYWFEFKRSAFRPNTPKWGLKHSLKIALHEVGQLYFDDGEVGVAGIIAVTDKMPAGRRKEYEDFCENVDFAFHLGPYGWRGAYLYFKILDGN